MITVCLKSFSYRHKISNNFRNVCYCCERASKKFVGYLKGNLQSNKKFQMYHRLLVYKFWFTFDLSKSGVSSVVVLIGGRVGDMAFIDPLEAEPTPCADADDA